MIKILLSLFLISLVFVFFTMKFHIEIPSLLYSYKPVLQPQNKYITEAVIKKSKQYARKQKIRGMFKERMQKIKDVCEKNLIKGVEDNAYKIGKIWTVNEKKGLVMCRTGKHGSTTWANYFVKIYTES